jgi:outer membrane protein assembly factor BamB
MNKPAPILCALLTCTISSAQPISFPKGPVLIDQPWWSHLGGSSTHSTIPFTQGTLLDTPSWTSTGDENIELSFIPQAGVVADELHVYAIGFDQSFARHLAAFDQESGELIWSSDIPFAILDSWSSPSIDPNNHSVIVASGFSVSAFNRFNGDELWNLPTTTPIVNASPCVTDDLDGSNRAFITDYTFAAAPNGSLICINLDPSTPTNPFEPGETMWAASLPGDCSGNTPAYHDGIVYVATADNGSGGAGHILAFDATSTTTPSPLWDTPNPEPFGFFGGVTYHNGSIYASSYNFQGGQRSANTIKLDATTGALQWSVPTVRTNATPIVLNDNRIIVSGGVPTSPSTIFTGSLPAIELIQDQGNSATLLWDTFEATHQDLNESGTWDQDEPYLSIGGWGHHPIAMIANGNPRLITGTMSPPTAFDPFTHAESLHTIDLSKHPSDPDFIISTQSFTGTSPALFNGRVFSTSNEGLSALDLINTPPAPPLAQQIRAIIDGRKPISSLKSTP